MSNEPDPELEGALERNMDFELQQMAKAPYEDAYKALAELRAAMERRGW